MSSHTHSHGPAPAAPQPLPGVDSIIAVGSGKGGVGKTTLAVNLAIAMARMGFKVGLLDADVYGPNVPTMLGTTVAPEVMNGDRILPPERYGLKVMSVGFLSPGDKPLVWRGPMLHSIIKQFLGQVEWGQLDYLIIDLPPGTGDVVISLVQTVPLTGAVVVTTPSDVSLQDARKAIEMFKQVKVDILGVVENMSYLMCPALRAGDRHLLQGWRRAHRCSSSACLTWAASKSILTSARAAIPVSRSCWKAISRHTRARCSSSPAT